MELTAEQVEALWQDNVISAIFFVWVGDRTVKSVPLKPQDLLLAEFLLKHRPAC